MALIWIALQLALLEISLGYKLPREAFIDEGTHKKGQWAAEDPSISSLSTASVFPWPTHGFPSDLKNNSSKVLRVKRDTAAGESPPLEEFMTAPNLDEEFTTEEDTNTAEVLHIDPTAEPKHTQRTDSLPTQTDVVQESTPHILVTNFSTSSTMLDVTHITRFKTSDIVTELSSTRSPVTFLLNDTTPVSTTENSTANISTGPVDFGIRPATALTETPVETPTTTLSTTLSHVDLPDSTAGPSETSLTNGGNITPEKQNIMQSLMGQCLLAISILALVATIFIISTIVLATKLSNLRNRYKLLNKSSTEMVCISALLPDSEQASGKSKVKPNKLKTFAASPEEGDGDNLTLNSFLPDH
ncbi:P-selectin glycoprotein ligand 1 isoform X2 [Ambystoma mexicanum]